VFEYRLTVAGPGTEAPWGHVRRWDVEVLGGLHGPFLARGLEARDQAMTLGMAALRGMLRLDREDARYGADGSSSRSIR